MMNRMGVNARVYCDCYEIGKVKIPPPQPDLVYVDQETGEICLHWEERGADQRRFYDWLSSACEHPHGKLVLRLGNIAGIGFLRERFMEASDRFPILISKVVHNGTHFGDALTLLDLERVAGEMLAVRDLHCADDLDEAFLREFESHMLELLAAARSVSKPVAF